MFYHVNWASYLTHWGRDKMAAISQTTLSNAFSWMKLPKGPINNIPALVQIMAWRRPGDKPLSEPMMVSLLTQPQWVNQSLCTGIFPDKLKTAKVIPWYKKDNTSFGSYRPKSLLSSMSKSFERVSFNQLYDYFTSNGLLYESQCGFR